MNEHATLETQCPRCASVRLFASHLSHDPWGWAKEQNRQMAAAWLRSHPCQ